MLLFTIIENKSFIKMLNDRGPSTNIDFQPYTIFRTDFGSLKTNTEIAFYEFEAFFIQFIRRKFCNKKFVINTVEFLG